MKPSELVKKLNEDVAAINLASMFGGMPQSYQERATCYKAAADLIEGLIPRPIEEAPKGEDILVYLDDLPKWAKEIKYPPFVVGRCDERGYLTPDCSYVEYDITSGDAYVNLYGEYEGKPNHFIPLSAIQKLMESGE